VLDRVLKLFWVQRWVRKRVVGVAIGSTVGSSSGGGTATTTKPAVGVAVCAVPSCLDKPRARVGGCFGGFKLR